MCVCVCGRERERETETLSFFLISLVVLPFLCMCCCTCVQCVWACICRYIWLKLWPESSSHLGEGMELTRVRKWGRVRASSRRLHFLLTALVHNRIGLLSFQSHSFHSLCLTFSPSVISTSLSLRNSIKQWWLEVFFDQVHLKVRRGQACVYRSNRRFFRGQLLSCVLVFSHKQSLFHNTETVQCVSVHSSLFLSLPRSPVCVCVCMTEPIYE